MDEWGRMGDTWHTVKFLDRRPNTENEKTAGTNFDYFKIEVAV